MKLPASDGSSQEQRLPAALADGYFVPFELSFPQSVALLRDVASCVKFDNSNGGGESWRNVLDQNTVVRLCRLFVNDNEYYEKKFEVAVKNGLSETAAFTDQLANEVSNWLDLVKSVTSAAHAHRVQEHVVKLIGWSNSTRLQDEQFLDADKSIIRLRSDIEELMASLHEIRQQVLPYIENSLRSGQIDPSAGLLIVFIQLLMKIQQNANNFTARHTDFFYKRLLGAKPGKGSLDRTFVCLEPSPAMAELLVPKNTVIENGVDSKGTPNTYRTNGDLRVNSSWVSSICTLNMERDKLVSPECDLGYVTRLFSQKMEFTKQAVQKVSSIPVFGAYRSSSKRTDREDGEVGFAIASGLFQTQRARRKFTLTIKGDTEFESNAGVLGALYQLRQLQHKQEFESDLSPELEAEESKSLLIRRVVKQFLTQEMLPGDVPTTLEIDKETQAQLLDLSSGLAAVVNRNEGSIHQLYRDLLLHMVLEADTEQAFKSRLGRFIAPYLLGRTGWLTEPVREKLIDYGSRLISDWEERCNEPNTTGSDSRVFDDQVFSILRGAKEDGKSEFTLHFYHLFRTLFNISITVEDGWLKIENWKITPKHTESGIILIIDFHLAVSDPAITAFNSEVHSGEFCCDTPLCKLILNQTSNFYSYSPLSDVLLDRIDIDLDCKGVTELEIHAESGEIDASKPFPFFGPMATVGSFMVLGVAEATSKPIDYVEFQIDWFNLPAFADGFASYFKEYPENVRNEHFVAKLEYLYDGEWKSIATNPSVTIFGDADIASETVLFRFDIAPGDRFTQHTVKDGASFGPQSRRGYFRFVLEGPKQAFGAQDYTKTFAEVSMANAKRRFGKPLSLPQSPFALTCQRVSANYVATDSLNLVQPEGSGFGRPMQFFHIHPFGVLQIPLEKSYLKRSLIPEYSYDGNLMVAISFDKPISTVDIYFELDEKMSDGGNDSIAEVNWYYLRAEGWIRMPKERILEDSTVSFNRSGIVSLQLPDDIVDNNSLMPVGRYWFRVSAKDDLSSYGKIRKIATHSVEVTRTTETKQIPEVGGNWVLGSDLPGVLGVKALGIHYDWRPAESEKEFRTRMSERLRHKNRALLPWDYERLVLSNFPDVFKCKCIKSMRLDGKDETPGRVLMVLVAKDFEPEKAGQDYIPQLSAVRLHEINSMLKAKAPSNISIHLVNPIVERLQVRCSVLFNQRNHSGEFKQRLNSDISKFLWPWLSFGYSAQFDWIIRLEDVKTYIKELPYVDMVTEFSMLQLTENQSEQFALTDMALASKPVIGASFHGSIAAPMDEHFIHVIDSPSFADKKAVGVDELQLNSTFVIAEAHNHV